MTKGSLSIVASLVVTTTAMAQGYYVEPTIGVHHTVDEDHQKQKSELLAGLRLGTELSSRLSAELGVMTGKPKGKNGYESKRENLATAGIVYHLTENTEGFVPYVTASLGTLDGVNSSVIGAGLKYVLPNHDAIRLDVKNFIQNGDRDVVTTIGYVFTLGDKQTPHVTPPSLKAPLISSVSTESKSYETQVYFDFDKATIKSAEAKKLDMFATNLLKAHRLKVSLTGYADALGKPSYNKKLSHKRAHRVKTFLESKGLKVAMKTQGKGVKGPQKSPLERAKNRVVIVNAEGSVTK